MTRNRVIVVNPYAPPETEAQRSKRHPSALLALGFSLAALFFFAPLFAPLALVHSLRTLRATGLDPTLSGHGLALAALVLSGIAAGVSVLF